MSLQITGIRQPSEAVVALIAGSDGRLTVENSDQLFAGTFTRSGSDLFISHDGMPDVFIPGYFLSQNPFDIYDPNGAVLKGETIALLAGPLAPGQYAQTGAVAPGGNPIGQVETVNGEATVQRTDGTVEVLQVGSRIYEQDVIQTADGAAVSVTFVDGTIFTLASASRMVIDELIYDPESTENAGGFSLLQGSFVFIAGQVAKTGDMEVSTPSSTMGIRGTTVLVQVTATGGVVTSAVTLTRDPDGSVGIVELRDADGNLVANITDTDTKWLVSSAGGETREVLRTLQDDADDNLLIAEAFAAFRSAVARVDSGDTFVTLSDPDVSPLPSGSGLTGDNSLQVDSIDEPTTIETVPDVDADDTDDFVPFDDGELQPDLSDEPQIFTVSGPEDASGASAISGQVDVVGGTGTLIYSLSAPPGAGTVSFNPDGSFSFEPAPDFNGTDSFSFTVVDEEGDTAQGIVFVEVLPVNDAPVATAGAASVPEDGILIGTAPATDIDGDVLAFSVLSAPANGELVLQDNGTYSYTPDTDFAGTDSFGFRVTDPDGLTSDGVVTLTVTQTNDAPFVIPGSSDLTGSLTVGPTVETVSGDLVAGDIDPGDTQTWSGTGTSEFGAFSVDPGGTWTFTLDPDGARRISQGETEVVTFTATVTDAAAASTDQQVSITLTGINNAPVASAGDSDLSGDIDEAVEDTSISGTLAATDADDISVLTWTIAASSAVYGVFSVTASGVWTYTIDNAAADPLEAGETAAETLTVRVTDEFGAFDDETVTVTVTGTNDAPIVSRTSIFETTDGIAVADTLTALDIDGTGPLTFAAGGDAPENGSVSIGSDGTFTYIPDPGFMGVDRFTYTVADGDGGQTTGIVEIEVENADVTDGDQSVTIGVSRHATADTAAGAVVFDVENDAPTTRVNLAVVMDSSGSISTDLWASLLQSVDDAMQILADQFAGSSTQVDLRFVTFASFASSSAKVDLQSDDLSSVILGLPYLGTGTNWQEAFSEAGEFLLEEPASQTNYMIFVTDGKPSSGGWETSLADLTNPADGRDPVFISAFGFGNADLVQLRDVDPDASLLASPSDLAAAFQETPLFAPELIDLSVVLEADGVDRGEIADETIAGLRLEGIDYELPLASIENIADLLGNDNRLTITARFDTDGDKSTAELELTSLDALGRADGAQVITGLNDADLLFGSDADDTINGGAGDDVILAYDGDDIINAGAGDDTVLAGDGDDRITASEMPVGTDVVRGGVGRDVFAADVADITALLAATDLSGIEAIDMDNGRADALELDLADIVSLSDTPDTDLEALLGAALPESVTIYGETGDTLNVTTGAGESLWDAGLGTVTDGSGEQFTIYEYVDSGGEILATLAVGIDVGVASDGATV
ncbi:Ig-like domain-containing protein [uncultured Roseobacter sp.]|uniref:tandem-95 repeat protein n=1 Tax=uncultured Roseobacter sp. TaxID=114847 RepID=UPI00261CF697|nr:Ig-like domain-containing protein [uncultured Roseobacter sp.]